MLEATSLRDFCGALGSMKLFGSESQFTQSLEFLLTWDAAARTTGFCTPVATGTNLAVLGQAPSTRPHTRQFCCASSAAQVKGAKQIQRPSGASCIGCAGVRFTATGQPYGGHAYDRSCGRRFQCMPGSGCFADICDFPVLLDRNVPKLRSPIDMCRDEPKRLMESPSLMAGLK